MLLLKWRLMRCLQREQLLKHLVQQPTMLVKLRSDSREYLALLGWRLLLPMHPACCWQVGPQNHHIIHVLSTWRCAGNDQMAHILWAIDKIDSG